MEKLLPPCTCERIGGLHSETCPRQIALRATFPAFFAGLDKLKAKVVPIRRSWTGDE